MVILITGAKALPAILAVRVAIDSYWGLGRLPGLDGYAITPVPRKLLFLLFFFNYTVVAARLKGPIISGVWELD